ncbi:hypothetical protein TH61_00590 [Rufibacter sp. DG15C]|uniref:hypothetical protein n=1 Tax=Rufibacter sp. DG15C TaxID=1379909 RepID=UPI00078EBD99|nr:hypothetical protein [Rufibacter sp. DG15C]AMM49976.1 hypothetical protein TH61_00590 [Rufibacter sp. DG15C]
MNNATTEEELIEQIREGLNSKAESWDVGNNGNTVTVLFYSEGTTASYTFGVDRQALEIMYTLCAKTNTQGANRSIKVMQELVRGDKTKDLLEGFE